VRRDFPAWLRDGLAALPDALELANSVQRNTLANTAIAMANDILRGLAGHTRGESFFALAMVLEQTATDPQDGIQHRASPEMIKLAIVLLSEFWHDYKEETDAARPDTHH